MCFYFKPQPGLSKRARREYNYVKPIEGFIPKKARSLINPAPQQMTNGSFTSADIHLCLTFIE
jgi:hypothetical protein